METAKTQKIYAENVEQVALDQFESAMEQTFTVKGALMPDAHMGYSLPIGAVVATQSYILPAWVGYDIGCGMCAIQTTFETSEVQEHAKEIFNQIYRDVPVGFKKHASHPLDSEGPDYLFSSYTQALEDIFEAKEGFRSLGTLGSGNHFIEIGVDEDNHIWIVIHSGSRGLGHGVASHYMRLASGDGKAREGHFGFDTGSQEGLDYIKDMGWCLEFALKNRSNMLDEVFYALLRYCPSGGERVGEMINRNHNHAEELGSGIWIHRKGATQAEKGMMGVIPGNMKEGSYIVRGKGNPESLWSSSHGAGRIMSRKVAKAKISPEDFTKEMEGIQAKVDKSTLDESPGAYKNIHEVMALQKDLVDIVAYVRPLINIKG